jgi:DNA repair exonuclease SbcCD ATPase subunit
MEKAQSNRDELTVKKVKLEERIHNYKARLSELAGPCSRQTVGRQIEECEMELEQVRSHLGEI